MGVNDVTPPMADAYGRCEGAAGEASEDVEAEIIGDADAVVVVHQTSSHAETCNGEGRRRSRKQEEKLYQGSGDCYRRISISLRLVIQVT
jgi:hypothetical protein